MLTMLGIPNCDTVRKARRHLDEAGFAYTFRDLRKQPLDRDEWSALIAQDSEGRLVNTRGPSFRKAGIAKDTLTPESSADLLLEHPTAMKRPAMLRDDRLLTIGYDAASFLDRLAGP